MRATVTVLRVVVCIGIMSVSLTLAQDNGTRHPDGQDAQGWVDSLCGDLREQYAETLPLWPDHQVDQHITAVRETLLTWGPMRIDETMRAQLRRGLMSDVESLQREPGPVEYTAAQGRVFAFCIRRHLESGPLTAEQEAEFEDQVHYLGELLRDELLKLLDHCTNLLRENGSSARLDNQVVEEARQEFEGEFLSPAAEGLATSFARPLTPSELEDVESTLRRASEKMRADTRDGERLAKSPDAGFEMLSRRLTNVLRDAIFARTDPEYPQEIREAIGAAVAAYEPWSRGYTELQRIQATMLFWDQALLLENCLREAEAQGP